jgi:hypothetical protein
MSKIGAILSHQYLGGTEKKVLSVDAGQSNQVGTNNGAPSDPNLLIPSLNSFIWNNSTFEVLEYGVNNKGASGGHGMELNLAFASPRPNYQVKVALGGTSLIDDWYDGSALRNQLISEINAARAVLGDDYEIWFQWNQWNGDVVGNQVGLYYDALVSFIQDLQAKTITFRHITIVKADLATPYDDVITQDMIDVQEMYVANTHNADILSTDDLSFIGDGIHLDSDSQNTVAEREFAFRT